MRISYALIEKFNDVECVMAKKYCHRSTKEGEQKERNTFEMD